MGKSGRGKQGKSAASSSSADDALLEAAIAENSKHLMAQKEKVAAAAVKDTVIAGRCEAYKRSTAAFLDWLALKSPTFAARTVRSILTAASGLRSQGVTLPSGMAQNLRNAITLRREVHRLYQARAQKLTLDDERHAHFIHALEMARDLLTAGDTVQSTVAAVQTVSSPAATPPEDVVLTLANRFEGLHVEETSVALDESERGADDRVAMVGSAVVIEGVTSQPELNGKDGVVTSYNAIKDRYEVRVDSLGRTMSLRAASVRRVRSMAVSEEEKFVLGTTIEFEAACLLLDLQGLLEEVNAAWSEYAAGRCSLLAATALTNACVRHAERLASSAELRSPLLSSIDRIVCAAHMMHTIMWVRSFLGVSLEKALPLVSELTHGRTGDTVMPTLAGNRVLYAVQLQAALVAEDMALPSADTMAAAGQRGKARELLRSYDCTGERAEALLRRVTADAVERIAKPIWVEGGSGFGFDPDDFYLGDNGLLLTASFLRILASPKLNIVKRPKVWSAPKPGFFGPIWDEAHSPAACTNELADYTGGVVPALLHFADGEMRTKGGGRLSFPELKMGVLMPLWHILENAMDQQAATLPLTIAIQALLLSVARVNGGGRCRRVQMTMRRAFTNARKQIERDLAVYTAAAERGCSNSHSNKKNLEMLFSWVDFTERRHNTPPFSSGGREMEAISVRQRDQALLQNPWVAGQQLLVLSLGVGIGCGSAMLDSHGQASFLLHLQNALQVAGAARSVPLVDDTLAPALGSDNKAVWFAGVPRSNFMKAWYHRMGMDANTKNNRKLVPIEAADLSAVYRCVAEDDFSSLSVAESSNPLPLVLDAIRSAFASDRIIGFNLAALGAKLNALPEHLVDALGMRERVNQELVEMRITQGQNSHGSSKRKGRGGAVDEKTYRAAVYTTLVSELFQLCEQEVPDQNEPFHVPGKAKYANTEGRQFQGRKDLPSCSAAQRSVLEAAGNVVQAFIQSFDEMDLRII